MFPCSFIFFDSIFSSWLCQCKCKFRAIASKTKQKIKYDRFCLSPARWDMNHFFYLYNFFYFFELNITHQPIAEIFYQNLSHTPNNGVLSFCFFSSSMIFRSLFSCISSPPSSSSSFYFVVVTLSILLFT